MMIKQKVSPGVNLNQPWLDRDTPDAGGRMWARLMAATAVAKTLLRKAAIRELRP